MSRIRQSMEYLIDSEQAVAEVAASHSTTIGFTNGTGLSVYQDLLLPAILEAKHEVILATCFWAPSKTLDHLVSTLRQLSGNAVASQSQVSVHICLSSVNAFQKLFHTSSHSGFIYPPDQYADKLGLPKPSELPGLNMTVKSMFFRPFSVLHSKYLIVDRQRVYLPSCNVSWEEWYECCIGLKGPIVHAVYNFWDQIWHAAQMTDDDELHAIDVHDGSQREGKLRTTLLPHPHNSSLRQALWFLPERLAAPLPATPLNHGLLRLLFNAEREIILLTPNFTSPPAFYAICFALRNGVAVKLITDRRMMVPEQLVTAGTVTEQYVRKLIKAYQKDLNGPVMHRNFESYSWAMSAENQAKLANTSSVSMRPGKLTISYFQQPNPAAQELVETRTGIAAAANKSHVKLTLVDRKSIVLGSGNMDRASWVTSQELGVLIEDQGADGKTTGTVEGIWAQVEQGLVGCLENYFES